MDYVMGVTVGQFAHERHGNDVDRQPGVTTRRPGADNHAGGYLLAAGAGLVSRVRPVAGRAIW
jgi:hypothetical protein